MAQISSLKSSIDKKIVQAAHQRDLIFKTTEVTFYAVHEFELQKLREFVQLHAFWSMQLTFNDVHI
jgi:hypothetical protein